ncbi:nucleolar protein 7 [Salmo salar]|uniref:Nucleolar protein 7 n=1 Tax=Salmo salar TaxID=8030 RepID=A0A1S3LUT3_SALSA|nr:nucleolar protein 7 [Salmo salar]|eukprot:XP_013994590.1 PREDICTED: nucleolar protein 7 [Salmo salar]
MAKKLLRKSPSSSNKFNSANMTDDFQLHLDSSDDDAPPEEVTFEESKASALRSMKNALETSKRGKELLKEKRRKRQELFQEQKKRRLLPAHILEEIDTAPSKKQKLPGDQADSNNEEASCSWEEGSEGSKETKKGFKGNIRSLKGNYSVMRMADQSSTNSQQQTAMDFIQARLYGPGSRRTTNNELLSLQNKRGPNKSAAMQFVNKKWGTEKKAKAEKLKKQWIHKQKVPSS